MPPHTPTVEGFKKGRVPREVRSRQLLDLAEQIFLENGYEGFSIEDLCRAAGVTRPVVYEHFGSKEGLFLACQRRIRTEFHEALDAGLAASDLETAIRGAADAFFGMLEDNPKRWLFVFCSTTGLVGPLAEELYDLRAQTVDRIAEVGQAFAPSMDEEAVVALAQAVSGAGEGLGRWWMRNRHIPRERIVDYQVRFTLAAMAAAQPVL